MTHAEQRNAGAFIQPEKFDDEKELDRKRDFIERAAIAALQGLLSDSTPITPQELEDLTVFQQLSKAANKYAQALWLELQKETDNGKA